MSEEHSELDGILKKVCYRYFYSIIGIFLLFTIFYYYYNIEPLSYLSGLYTVVHIFWFFIPYRLSYRSIKVLIPVYFVFLSFAMIPIVSLFWQIGQITAFFWYLLIPLASTLFFSSRFTIYWSAYIFTFICLIFLIVPFIPEKYNLLCTSGQIAMVNILTILCCSYMVFFFLYYLDKVNRIKMKELLKNESNLVLHSEDKKEVNNNRYKELYKEIVYYFEKEKPYCDPDFSVSQLATAINSNITYISKAIKINRNVNFNVFINIYRVNMVKSMLEKDYHNRYTMMHIYTSSGFKHQSTFNKVFKQIEGVTPSEYIKNLISHENDEIVD